MKNLSFFSGQFAPKLGGQFGLESGGQFAPKFVVNLDWNWVVNLTVFSTLLENASLTDVRSNIESARAQIERSQFLVGKYGEEIARKLIDNDYFLGMTEDQLIDSRGKPSKIETEVMKTKTKVIYIYGNKSSGDVFNFVNGELERFTDR